MGHSLLYSVLLSNFTLSIPRAVWYEPFLRYHIFIILRFFASTGLAQRHLSSAPRGSLKYHIILIFLHFFISAGLAQEHPSSIQGLSLNYYIILIFFTSLSSRVWHKSNSSPPYAGIILSRFLFVILSLRSGTRSFQGVTLFQAILHFPILASMAQEHFARRGIILGFISVFYFLVVTTCIIFLCLSSLWIVWHKSRMHEI